MAPQSTTIGSLPNEILINILSYFPTLFLLHLTLTSHHIHNLILQIIHARLLSYANLPDHKLVLECYHPSAKPYTPYYVCEYLGTSTLNANNYPLPDTMTLGQLHNLYSHYRPMQPEGDRKVWTLASTGGWRTASLDTFKQYKEELVSQKIDLESYELFSQLQSTINVVKLAPNRSTFANCTVVGQGLTRVWRDWLGERAERLMGSGKEGDEGEGKEGDGGKRLLWATVGEDFGLRLRVIEGVDAEATVGQRRDEDGDVSYTLQYEELVVRTSQILLQIEQLIF